MSLGNDSEKEEELLTTLSEDERPENLECMFFSHSLVRFWSLDRGLSHFVSFKKFPSSNHFPNTAGPHRFQTLQLLMKQV